MSSASSPSDCGGSDMSDGIMAAVRPAVQKLDGQVQATRQSQVVLATHIQQLSDLLHDMSQDQPFDLDVYSRKLDDSRRRVANSGKVLENVHDRLGKLQRDIARQAHQFKSTMTAPPPAPPHR